ncbi:hypothetical protein DB771_14730 [Burkholderia sp. AU29985]|nr:hypothetical protein AK34_5713 [Burkholderia dolosa AU0158]ETP61621.1 hypothetical protein BDSB_28165 [Burkholderia dolosa PC543]PUA76090.1 hypothetical protein DB771_14730 [Burkholderia sp. AU29985]
MHDREAIIPAGMEAVYERIGYAPAVRVRDTVYVSGQIGRDAVQGGRSRRGYLALAESDASRLTTATQRARLLTAHGTYSSALLR